MSLINHYCITGKNYSFLHDLNIQIVIIIGISSILMAPLGDIEITLGYISKKDYERIVRPEKMIKPS